MSDKISKLTASNIRYLIVLNEFSTQGEGVRCIQLAQTLGVSKPSVHTMINNLKKLNLVNKDLYGAVCFTQEGRKLAGIYYKYYKKISLYFEKLFSDTSQLQSAICAVMAEVGSTQLEEMCLRTELNVNKTQE